MECCDLTRPVIAGALFIKLISLEEAARLQTVAFIQSIEGRCFYSKIVAASIGPCRSGNKRHHSHALQTISTIILPARSCNVSLVQQETGYDLDLITNTRIRTHKLTRHTCITNTFIWGKPIQALF